MCIIHADMLWNSYTCLHVFERTCFWLGVFIIVLLNVVLYLELTPATEQRHGVSGHHNRKRTGVASYRRDNGTGVRRLAVSGFTEMTTALRHVIQNGDFYRRLHARVVNRTTRLEIILDYPEFNTSEPFFLNHKDKATFLASSDNRKFLGLHKPIGVVALLKNGTAEANLDCGAYTDLETFDGHLAEDETRLSDPRDVVCPLFIPDGGFFQHFLDGVLPKIVQIYDILRAVRIKLLLNKPRNKSVLDMLRSLDMPEDAYVFDGAVRTGVQLNTCKTPPIHPILWQRGRRLLVPSPMTSSADYVILVVRRRTRNRGRRIVNERQITWFLKRRYPERFRLFSGDLTFAPSRDLFSQAAVVIGCHGGGMYNVHFSRSGTDVVELMPITASQTPPSGLSHTVIWRVSDALRLRYWRLHSYSLNARNDVELPVDQLKTLLDRIDSFRNN